MPLKVKVASPNVSYTNEAIHSTYTYRTTLVEANSDASFTATPQATTFEFKTSLEVPRLGLMLVGWGGNNGSTLTGSLIANRFGMRWRTKDGEVKSNYIGSITQSSTVCLGTDSSGVEQYVALSDLLPMVHPNDIVIDGWDINSCDLSRAMERARVLDYNLQVQLKPHMEKLRPRPSIYCPDFIAANQADRADNVLTGTKGEMVEQLRADIRDFKKKQKLDKVIVLWTANTERFCDVRAGLNLSADDLLGAIDRNEDEISPSTLFAVASIREGCTYINGSPQNSLVPGVVDLAEKANVYVGGDDFKSGQTKLKSVLVDFLVSAGIKPRAIVSYNHLGNNDGKNLSAPQQFRSKEISKSNVVDDMVESNRILYEPGEKPDHCVVIKYVPFVADSKRAMDEYTSEIFMGGLNTIAVHNTCEDSLLASPIILDLAILAEMCERISLRKEGDVDYAHFNSVLSLLSYLLKAPMVPRGTPIVNALFRQRACIENVFRACLGLEPQNHMLLEHKLASPQQQSALSATRVQERVGEKQSVSANGDTAKFRPLDRMIQAKES